MKNKIWIVDFVAFSGFLLALIPKLTGHILHEWLGLAIGLVLLVHLVQHWHWVKTISKRFNAVKGNTRLKYGVDILMAIGCLMILLSGLMISSLLNLGLPGYFTWRAVHSASSFITLGLLVCKIALHWSVIKAIAAKVVAHPKKTETLSYDQLSRRNFLIEIGFAGLGLLVVAGGMASLLKKIGTAGANVSSSTSIPTDHIPPQVLVSTPLINPVTAPTTAVNPTTMPQVIPTPTVQSTVVVQTGRILCNKRCSYPGRCHQYQDNNQNGLCDRGEPIW